MRPGGRYPLAVGQRTAAPACSRHRHAACVCLQSLPPNLPSPLPIPLTSAPVRSGGYRYSARPWNRTVRLFSLVAGQGRTPGPKGLLLHEALAQPTNHPPPIPGSAHTPRTHRHGDVSLPQGPPQGVWGPSAVVQTLGLDT